LWKTPHPNEEQGVCRRSRCPETQVNILNLR
jgi:hypothetical protein